MNIHIDISSFSLLRKESVPGLHTVEGKEKSLDYKVIWWPKRGHVITELLMSSHFLKPVKKVLYSIFVMILS